MQPRKRWIYLLGVFILVAIVAVAAYLLIFRDKTDQRLLGKWEVVDSPEAGSDLSLWLFSPGDTLEFLKDGTVIIGTDLGTMTASYKWLDARRLAIAPTGGAQSLVFDVTRTANTLRLHVPSTGSTLVLKPYQEFSPSVERLAGVWTRSDDNSTCFASMDEAPYYMTFNRDGTFSSDFSYILGQEVLKGEYQIRGGRIHIEATGVDTGVLGMGKKELTLSVDCEAVVTNAKLFFIDENGNKTVYIRGKYE